MKHSLPVQLGVERLDADCHATPSHSATLFVMFYDR